MLHILCIVAFLVLFLFNFLEILEKNGPFQAFYYRQWREEEKRRKRYNKGLWPNSNEVCYGSWKDSKRKNMDHFTVLQALFCHCYSCICTWFWLFCFKNPISIHLLFLYLEISYHMWTFKRHRNIIWYLISIVWVLRLWLSHSFLLLEMLVTLEFNGIRPVHSL